MKIFRSLLAGPTLLAGGILIAQSTSPVHFVGSGVDYSRGRYGLATATEVVSFPLEITRETSRWVFRAMFSWLRITGPSAAALTGGDGGLTRPTSASESGVGDIYLDATHRSGALGGGLNLDTTFRVKLPTADERRGLGTGEPDYYAQVTAYRTFGDLTPFASGGYRVLGDSERYTLRDGAYASAGAHLRTSNRTVLTASFDWRDRIAPGADVAQEVSVAVTHDLTPRWRLLAYGVKGFTDASPDAGGGLRLNYRF